MRPHQAAGKDDASSFGVHASERGIDQRLGIRGIGFDVVAREFHILVAVNWIRTGDGHVHPSVFAMPGDHQLAQFPLT